MAADASAAAAALTAALVHSPAQRGSTSALLEAVQPAVYCSLSVAIGGAAGAGVCSSGNLLSPDPTHSSLFSLASSLSGLVLREGRAKLVQLRPGTQHRRRSLPEDVRFIASQSAATTLVGIPLLAPGGHRGSGAGRAGPSTSAGTPAPLGVMTVGFASPADVTLPALKQCILVAQAAALEQAEALREFGGMVGAMLDPQRLERRQAPAGDPGSSSSDSDEDLLMGDYPNWSGSELSDSDAEGPSGRHLRGVGGSEEQAGNGGTGMPPGSRAHPLTLQFRVPSCELAFATYQAAHLQRIDALAYLICLCFFCLEALLPATPLHTVPQHLPGCWSLPGCLALLPGLLLLSNRTRAWFSAHRDWMLFGTWVSVTGWMLALRSRHGLAAGDVLGALTVLGLAFQMRFHFLAPFLLAIHMQLLPALCTRHFLHAVVLPLTCCYCFEAHTRRLFLQHSWRP